MLPATCQALAGAGVKERVIEGAMHRLRALAMCHRGPGVHCWYVASFEGVPMLRLYWREAALQLLVMRGPAIGRLSHVMLVKTHCYMSYLRVPKGAINVLPTTLILLAARGLPSAVLQALCCLHTWIPDLSALSRYYGVSEL